eukprot:860256-Pelagomonas_calceolata.AAC.9
MLAVCGCAAEHPQCGIPIACAPRCVLQGVTLGHNRAPQGHSCGGIRGKGGATESESTSEGAPQAERRSTPARFQMRLCHPAIAKSDVTSLQNLSIAAWALPTQVSLHKSQGAQHSSAAHPCEPSLRVQPPTLRHCLYTP